MDPVVNTMNHSVNLLQILLQVEQSGWHVNNNFERALKCSYDLRISLSALDNHIKREEANQQRINEVLNEAIKKKDKN